MQNVLEMAVLGESASQETHLSVRRSAINVEIVQMTILMLIEYQITHIHTDKELTKLFVQSVS